MIKLLFLTALSWLNPSADSDSIRTETINGKLCVIHKVDEKETLFSISKRYGATLTSMLEFNPTAESGLEVGQLLKVPYTAKAKSPASSTTPSATSPSVATNTTSASTAQSGNGIHKVQPKETLFSISKLYNISVDDIKAWNYMKDNSISVGQDLRVKRPASFTESTPSTTTVTTPSVNTSTTTLNPAGKGTHTVAAGETMYSISRQYNVSVDQLKLWNNLTATELKIGQVLALKQPGTTVSSSTSPSVAVENKSTPLPLPSTTKQTPITTNTTPPVTKEEKKPTPVVNEPVIKISEGVSGSDEIKETGLAELIEGTEGNRKYLALHKTAKAGTIMKVKNELNNREVFVRVVGPLPNTGSNDKMVVKISRSAYDRLGAIDPKFRVEVTYYK